MIAGLKGNKICKYEIALNDNSEKQFFNRVINGVDQKKHFVLIKIKQPEISPAFNLIPPWFILIPINVPLVLLFLATDLRESNKPCRIPLPSRLMTSLFHVSEHP